MIDAEPAVGRKISPTNMNRTDMPTLDTQVLIAGAGPTGLVLALWLTKFGIKVRIVDKTAEAAPYSRALGVQARTLEFYQQAGIAGEVVRGGMQIRGINLWVSGARAAHVSFESQLEGLTPFPFILAFAQDAHERFLIEQLDAAGVKVERQTTLMRFDQQHDSVMATLKRADGSEDICRAAYLAGCDGAHSIVRESMKSGFPGGTYTHLFYVADVEASGPVTNDEAHVDLDAADLLAVFPMKGKGHVRLVGTMREEPGRRDAELTFDDVSDRGINQLKLTISKVNWFSTYRVHHRVADNFRKERAFLLGDAAHIHSPVGAQGMNTGIGDAVNLAWKLAAVLNGAAAENLLDSYELERIGFARRLVATTDRVFTVGTKPGFIAAQFRTKVFPLLALILWRMPLTSRFLFRTVSQIGVNYRGSPLSDGAAGSIRGGDRLPWVQNAASESAGTDNFAPLAAMAWQVHVYGEPRSGMAEACAGLGVPIHIFAWRSEMRRSDLTRGALYLVRPDGYVALADASGDPKRLEEYFMKRGLSARSSEIAT